MIHVSYAYKKDTKGERHGSAAGRIYIYNNKKKFLFIKYKFNYFKI